MYLYAQLRVRAAAAHKMPLSSVITKSSNEIIDIVHPPSYYDGNCK